MIPLHRFLHQAQWEVLEPMSRVERTNVTQNPGERRGSEQLRQARSGRAGSSRESSNPGHTPTKAEGEVADVEQALKNQKE
ncbi:MAG: hypothetical protein JO197_07135 [Acidobacteria bacterium]|nr:hypothetical protein [Acidobacteriota bacterium]MBV9475627.1 hypothetical protein [Acidobacteriota bacterium]